MIITEGLTDIYTVQKRLDEEAHHNLQEYVAKTHQHIEEMAAAYGLMLTYGTITGGYEPIPHASVPISIKKQKSPRTPGKNG